jgi:hypothetical protein
VFRNVFQVYKIQTPGNCPEESIQHSEHSESLKSGRENCTILLQTAGKTLMYGFNTYDYVIYRTLGDSTGQLKRDGTWAETRFRLSAKRTSPFQSAGGRQVSRPQAAEVCASAVVMVDTPCCEVV